MQRAIHHYAYLFIRGTCTFNEKNHSENVFVERGFFSSSTFFRFCFHEEVITPGLLAHRTREWVSEWENSINASNSTD